MNTYEVHFKLNGKYYKEFVTTQNTFKARELIRGRYSGAQILSVKKV